MRSGFSLLWKEGCDFQHVPLRRRRRRLTRCVQRQGRTGPLTLCSRRPDLERSTLCVCRVRGLDHHLFNPVCAEPGQDGPQTFNPLHAESERDGTRTLLTLSGWIWVGTDPESLTLCMRRHGDETSTSDPQWVDLDQDGPVALSLCVEPV